MYKPEDKQQTGQVTGTERSIVYSVLKNYDIEVKNISKLGNDYIINTQDNDLCLKRIRHGRESVERLFRMTEYITDKGFCNLPRYIKTKEERLFVKYKHCYFYITSWSEGREVNLNDYNELLECIRTLTGFHISASGSDSVRYLETYGNLKNWPLIFMESCSKLGWYKRIIEKKNIRPDFDKAYYLNIDFYNKLGTAAMELLGKADFHELSAISRKKGYLFINKFSSKSLLYLSDGKIFFPDVSTAVRDTAINNLGKILRKIMASETYQWKFEIAKGIIETYRELVPISDSEIKGLLAFIIFPYQFCKLGKKRYEKHKYWSEEKYLKKLNKVLKYKEKICEFIKEYTSFYGIDMEQTFSIKLLPEA